MFQTLIPQHPQLWPLESPSTFNYSALADVPFLEFIALLTSCHSILLLPLSQWWWSHHLACWWLHLFQWRVTWDSFSLTLTFTGCCWCWPLRERQFYQGYPHIIRLQLIWYFSFHSPVVIFQHANGILIAVNFTLHEGDVVVAKQPQSILKPTVVHDTITLVLSLLFALITNAPQAITKVI